VDVTVNPVNDVPTISVAPVTTNEDTASTIPLTTFDVDGDTLSVSNTTPAHGSASCTVASCSYSPFPNYNGPDSFDVTVNDGHGGTATATVSITVTAVNDAPTAADRIVSTNEDTRLM